MDSEESGQGATEPKTEGVVEPQVLEEESMRLKNVGNK
jgi:hypothetical protein